NLSSFNTAAVTSMHSMFQNCSNLIEINLGHFNTEKATSLSNMFNGCNSLEKVNLSGFNTSNITGYTGMFKDCSSLRTIDLSNFDMSKLSSPSTASNMFAGTTLLTKIYTPKNVAQDVALPEGVWNSKGEQNVTLLPKEKTTSEVFALGTTPTAEIDAFVVFNTDNTRKPTIKVRFHGLEAGDIDKITSFTLKIDNGDNLAGDDWKTNYVEAAGEYTQTITQELDFGDHTITVSVAGTSSLGTKEIQSVFTIPGVTLYSGNVVTEKGTLSWRINSAGELTVKGKGDLDDKGTNRSKENIPWYEHRALVKTAVISLSETENFSYLLADCTSLTTVDFSGTDTAATTNMTGMFSGSSSIGKLDLSSFTMENVAQAANMFTATTALTELYLPKNIPAAFSELTSLGLAQGTEAANKWYDCEGQEVTTVPTQKTYSDLWKKGTTPTAELRVLVKENIDNFRKPIVEVSFVGLDPETGMSSLKFVVDSDKEISVTDWQSLYNEETRVLSYTFSENLNAGSHVLKAVVTTNNTNTLEAEAEFTVRKSAVSMSVSAEEKELRKPLVKVKFIGLQDPSDILSLEITLQEVVMASPSNPSPSQMTVTVPVENWANYYNADTNEFSYQVQQELKTGEFRAKAVVTISNNITMTSKEATGSFTIAPSGTINNSKGGITWAIDSNGKLTVTGKGEIESGEGDRAAIDIPWNQYKAQITSAEISLSEIQDLSQLLNGCSNLLTVDISNLNTEATTNMKSMFNGCSKLTTITGLTAEGIDTSNVTTMESMFYGCKKLESLDLTGFSTEKVENMAKMFQGCTSLATLNVSSFNTEKVTDMSYMFYQCNALESLNLSNFKTTLVTKMVYMFADCKVISEINLSNFVTSGVTDMNNMFSGCNGLTSLNLSSFNTELVTNMNYMFRNCSSLEEINISSFNTANVTTMSNMFYGCSALTSLDLSSFDLTKVVYGNSQTPLSGFIGGLTSLTTLKTPKNISDTWNNTTAIQLPSKDGYFWFVEGVGEVTSMAVGQSQSQTIIRKERENITYVTMDLAVEETATEGR
ncbi:MAG: BspA family leucine-rich repeat surface protein, partial [Lachnospiraceae bacterium]|nr:BspA family leucine-rich repeat surface protein [Lachnospiraceae bacterium]